MKADQSYIEKVELTALEWQLDVARQLSLLKKQGKLPHAILVELNTSVDSQVYGWYLAAALLCQSEENADLPCGNCQSCQLMASNSYPDYSVTTLVENEKTHKLNKEIKIDQIRRLIHQFSLTNNLQAGKIALIYPAEKLNQSSANSLLKTLEEPSADSTLLLVTHNPGRLPVTIRSRCQKWTVNNPSPRIASSWLENQGISEDQIEYYLKVSHHDAQLALQLSQQQFKALQDQFSESLNNYLSGSQDIVTMIKQLKLSDIQLIRLALKTELSKLIYNMLKNTLSLALKQKLGKLLDLSHSIDRTLMVEENNLNFQLQLEDVLISLKNTLQPES